MKKLLTIFLLIFIPVFLFSATYYSQGDGNFGDTGNWNTQRDGSGSSPANINSTDDFVIQDGNTITADNDYTINSLTIESGGTFDGNNYTMTLNGDLTVDGTMTDNVNGSCNFTFSGSGTQNIGGSSTIEFYDLNFNGSGTYKRQRKFCG